MSELKTRVEAKRKRLEAELLDKKADAQGAASGAVRSVREKLTEVDALLREGWDNLSDSVKCRLKEWLR